MEGYNAVSSAKHKMTQKWEIQILMIFVDI